ncbi:MAG: hypothetical protein KGI00_03185 [Candidatus Micrarchaeota archaeon]|nr:hypothetical protein [Candidatus Micrarchaeota archaeon]MDE1849709.1 hypothetical protein [Candidatus Micrarchaeota archaeon]
MANGLLRQSNGRQPWLAMIQQGRELERISQKPILSPAKRGAIEARGVFNPAVVEMGASLLMVYRAEGRDGVSRLRGATSSDGLNWRRNGIMLDSPGQHLQLEDPRLTRMTDGRIIMTCTEANMLEQVAKIAIYEHAGKSLKR